MKILVILMLVSKTLFAANESCTSQYFKMINDFLLIKHIEGNVYRICEGKVITRGSLKFHTETNGLLSWRMKDDYVSFTNLVVESEVAGVTAYHFSTSSLIHETFHGIKLATGAEPFVFHINGQTISCDRKVEAMFNIEGILYDCRIEPTLINFYNQLITIHDDVEFHQNGKIALIYLLNETTLNFPLPGTDKILPLKGRVRFTPTGEISQARIATIPFLFNGQKFDAELEIANGSRCSSKGCEPYHSGRFYFIGTNPPKIPNHRYLLEKDDTSGWRSIYRSFCFPYNTQLDQFYFNPAPDYAKGEFIQDETFYDIKTGSLVQKKQENVLIPNVACNYRHEVDYKDLAKFIP